ncbi:MAG: hypothetical protein E6J34_19985 [Chloroflexi bacterium]|nr:MAG: hypothetical protein E6J34_19985 [Chloroflexota bacterium]
MDHTRETRPRSARQAVLIVCLDESRMQEVIEEWFSDSADDAYLLDAGTSATSSSANFVTIGFDEGLAPAWLLPRLASHNDVLDCFVFNLEEV